MCIRDRDDATALGVLGTSAGSLEQSDDELGVGEGVVDENFPVSVVSRPEHSSRLGAEHPRGDSNRSPAEHEMKRALPAFDEDARHARVLAPQHFDIDDCRRDARLAEGSKGGLRPGLPCQIGADERLENGDGGSGHGLTHPAARTSSCRREAASRDTAPE